MNPYVFVVGCPRSGTTLLQRMLDNHPQLAVANDTHFIPRVIEGVAGDPKVTSELVDDVLAYHRFPRLGIAPDDVRRLAADARTYSQLVAALYTEFGRRRGKPLAGEKTPDYVRRLPRLHSLFPSARSIHIVRDGRDVALSTLEWARPDKGPGRIELWHEQPVAACALWWRWQVVTGVRDGGALGSNAYLELRYEDLVAGPEETLGRAAAFLDVPDCIDMARYHEGRGRSGTGLSAKSAWLPPTPGLRDWRTQMPGHDVELFEAIAGDLLSRFGYERSVARISPQVAHMADRCRERWRRASPDASTRPRRGRPVTEAAPAGPGRPRARRPPSTPHGPVG